MIAYTSLWILAQPIVEVLPPWREASRPLRVGKLSPTLQRYDQGQVAHTHTRTGAERRGWERIDAGQKRLDPVHLPPARAFAELPLRVRASRVPGSVSALPGSSPKAASPLSAISRPSRAKLGHRHSPERTLQGPPAASVRRACKQGTGGSRVERDLRRPRTPTSGDRGRSSGRVRLAHGRSMLPPLRITAALRARE